MRCNIRANFIRNLEYGSTCWDPCREGQINAVDRVQKAGAQFANHTNVSDWETLVQRRAIARLCALFKACSGERAWKAISDSLRGPYCLSRVQHIGKVRDRKQRTDIGKYSFVYKIKGKAVPLQAWSGPEGSRELRFPDYMTTAQDGGKVASLTHRPPLSPGNAPGTLFC